MMLHIDQFIKLSIFLIEDNIIPYCIYTKDINIVDVGINNFKVEDNYINYKQIEETGTVYIGESRFIDSISINLFSVVLLKYMVKFNEEFCNASINKDGYYDLLVLNDTEIMNIVLLDEEIKPYLIRLKNLEIQTKASCIGHNYSEMTIITKYNKLLINTLVRTDISYRLRTNSDIVINIAGKNISYKLNKLDSIIKLMEVVDNVI